LPFTVIETTGITNLLEALEQNHYAGAAGLKRSMEAHAAVPRFRPLE
jgi:hypothetical protein